MNDLDLQQRLAAPQPELLGRPDLAAIHRQGDRRRRTRIGTMVAGSTLALSAVAGVGIGVVGQDREPRPDREVTVYAPPTAPEELNDLARRALDEVPGAVRVSRGQVVLPGPGNPPPHVPGFDTAEITRGPVDLGAHSYTGVTTYGRTAFPAWLYSGVEDLEQGEYARPDGSYSVGSTDMGILVDSGASELVCLAQRSSVGEDQPGDSCYPAVIVDTEDGPFHEATLGSPTFLEPGAEMELFASEDYSTGAPTTRWIGGLDGTSVDRVVLEMADGSTSRATVDSQLVPGDTMFWANVRGELVRVTAYAADGSVVDDHQVRACAEGDDCEVQ